MTNREYFIATLQACYFGDRNAFEEIIRIYDEKENIIKEVRELVNKEDFTMKQKYEMRESISEILDKENK